MIIVENNCEYIKITKLGHGVPQENTNTNEQGSPIQKKHDQHDYISRCI